MLQSYADGALVDATAVVGCAVDGIDNPCVFLSQLMAVFFLAKEAAAGKQGGKAFFEGVLNGEVRRCNDICKSFLMGYLEGVGKHLFRCFPYQLYYFVYHFNAFI